MRRAADFIVVSGGGSDCDLVCYIFLVDKMCHDALAHGAAADVAVADEKYLNHNLFLSQNARKRRVLARFADF